ncbi:MAG: arylamine N-acetyltransferase [Gammaproteobacteria bacterium]
MSLPDNLADRVLAKLELSRRPEPTLGGLHAVYSAWCRHVPFDNVRKLIHVRRQDPGILPGDDPEDFFNAWIRHGAGGTCWAGNGALCALLTAFGFDARRAVATMVVAPNLPPNHGSTTVLFDGRRYLVDASILHGEPLLLEEPLTPEGLLLVDEGATAATAPVAWNAACRMSAGHWHIRWRPLHKPEGIDCRIDRFDVDAASFRQLHEQSRAWSPFNYELHARTIRDTSVIGTAFGQRIEFDAGGTAQRALQMGDRLRFLVEEIGIHEELAAMVPPDVPTPTPPPPA